MRKAMASVVLFLLAFIFGRDVVVAAEPQTIVKTRVVLKEGGDPEQRQRLGAILTAAIQEINKIAVGRSQADSLRQYCTADGFVALGQLVEKTRCFSTIVEYQTNLLETATGRYEVRGINVRVDLAGTRGDPIQYLVFELNALGQITNVNFAIEEKYYNQIMQQGRGQNDLFNRQIILDLMEQFRTAHNRKDIAYLEKIYSEDALIIVGQVLQKKQKRNDEPDAFDLSDLGGEKIRFVKRSKQQYIDGLRRVFQSNAFVKVFFYDFEIQRHPLFADIYGVNVRQRWTSSNYDDHGYLFVMIDFRNKEQPLVRVRSWQPKPFEDGSVVRLGNFDVIKR